MTTHHSSSSPKTPNSSFRGYIIGFNIHSFVVVVVALLKVNSISEATHLLSRLAEHPSTQSIIEKFKRGPPTIVGILRCAQSSPELSDQDSIRSQLLDKQANLWLLFDEKENGWPKLSEVHCFGIRYTTSAQIIFYEPPLPRSYLVHSIESLRMFPESGDYLMDSKKALLEEGDFELTLLQIQHSGTIQRTIELVQSESTERVVTFVDNRTPYPGGYVVLLLLRFLMEILIFLKPLFEFVRWIFQPAPPEPNNKSKQSKPSTTSTKSPPTRARGSETQNSQSSPQTLTERLNQLAKFYRYVLSLSFFAQRIVSRMDELIRWPQIWKRGFTDITWIHFYNKILLLIIDFFMGLILGFYIIMKKDLFYTLSVTAHNFMRHDFSESYLQWLMGWPAGFKLNEELDMFLGNLFLLYIDNWSVIAHNMAKSFPYLINIIAVLGFCGMSSVFALVADIIAFLNMHIYWLYIAIAKVCSLQLSAISSLSLLFRGKKRNVLKKRIDSCNYSIDQLLLGTLLFCILVFLLPTTGIYYLFFLSARIIILLLHGLIAIGLVIGDDLPFLPLLLYFTRSKLLSGGVRFELCLSDDNNKMTIKRDMSSSEGAAIEDLDSANEVSSTYFRLKPNPEFSIGGIFSELTSNIRLQITSLKLNY